MTLAPLLGALAAAEIAHGGACELVDPLAAPGGAARSVCKAVSVIRTFKNACNAMFSALGGAVWGSLFF